MLLLLSCFSRVRLSATPWTVARWASLSMGFPRQEYWSGLPFPSPHTTIGGRDKGAGLGKPRHGEEEEGQPRLTLWKW